MTPRIIMASMLMALILGSWALWHFSQWQDARARRVDEEWQRAFEPTANAARSIVHPEDVLHERPLSPEEYDR